jgi:hypothetical protein
LARIRSDKPEAYQSETLAEISLAAERTFKGMATIADDKGRLADKPAQINGELWSMRGSHGKDDLESELVEMVKVDLVCRYTGCDGKRYVHMVSWDKHQKIDRPSKSRLPRCPLHQSAADYCGLHEGACDFPTPSRHPREGSRDLQQGETGHPDAAGDLASTAAPDPAPLSLVISETEGSKRSDQGEQKSSRHPREGSMQDLGSRTVDLGSKEQPAAAAGKPRPGTAALSDTQRSKRLTDAYAAAEPMCKWPAVNGIVLKAVRSGRFADDEIRDALLRLAAEGRSVTVETLRTELQGFPSARGAPAAVSGADRAQIEIAELKADLRKGSA